MCGGGAPIFKTHLLQIEQWCVLSGLAAQHFLHHLSGVLKSLATGAMRASARLVSSLSFWASSGVEIGPGSRARHTMSDVHARNIRV